MGPIEQSHPGDSPTATDMKKNEKNSSPMLIKGQLWKTDKGYIQIWHIGKLLIDYKMMKELGRKAVRTQATAISTLEEYLKDNAAVLVS